MKKGNLGLRCGTRQGRAGDNGGKDGPGAAGCID